MKYPTTVRISNDFCHTVFDMFFLVGSLLMFCEHRFAWTILVGTVGTTPSALIKHAREKGLL